MKDILRTLIALLISFVGTLLTFYVSLYVLLYLPVKDIYDCYMQDILTLRILFIDVVKIFLSATVGGAVWVVFDIVAGFFKVGGFPYLLFELRDMIWNKDSESMEK